MNSKKDYNFPFTQNPRAERHNLGENSEIKSWTGSSKFISSQVENILFKNSDKDHPTLVNSILERTIAPIKSLNFRTNQPQLIPYFKKIKSTISNLFISLVFDSGVAKTYPEEILEKADISVKNGLEFEPVTDISPYQVLAIKRPGFIVESTKILNNLEDDETFGIVIKDLKGLKAANNYGALAGIGGVNGDISIQIGNYIAKLVVEDLYKLIATDNILKEFLPYIFISTSRYGGDEISLSIKCPNVILNNGESLLTYLQEAGDYLFDELAQSFEINVQEEDNIVKRVPIKFKHAEAFNLSENPQDSNNKLKKLIYIKAITSSGLLLNDTEIEKMIQNPNTLTLFFSQIQKTEASKKELMDIIERDTDTVFLKKTSELSFKNPVFKYFFNNIIDNEKSINQVYTDLGQNLMQNPTEQQLFSEDHPLFYKQIHNDGLEIKNTNFAISRGILKSFILYTFEPIFDEVIANPTLINEMLMNGEIKTLSIINNQIKGANLINNVEGDYYILRSLKDSIIQILHPNIDPSKPEFVNEYNKLLQMTPRELLNTKFNDEMVASIGFGKNGPDVFVFATKEANSAVSWFVKALNNVVGFRAPHPQNPDKIIWHENGVFTQEHYYDDSLRESIYSAKLEWAKNISKKIINMGDADFEIVKNMIERFPGDSDPEIQKNYAHFTYQEYPVLANIAFSFQSWTNRKVENLTMVIDQISRYYSNNRTDYPVSQKLEFMKGLLVKYTAAKTTLV